MKRDILDYLNNEFTEPVRDPLWKNIFLSLGIKKLVSLGPFQRLAGIRQLGPAYHVYPGATHTRLAHSLGVFHLSRRLITVLLNDHDCPELSAEGVNSFLCAALLHDLGHFPYAHSLKELPLKEHEELTAEFILSEPIKSCLLNEVGADPLKTAQIVNFKMDAPDAETRFFRNLLSGVLDPDKLDYLNRDAFFCGVPYGIQDTDFVFSKIKPTSEGIAIKRQGISAIENILFSKYLMYRTIYWHKTVRIATAMIKKAVICALLDGKIKAEDLYGLNDDEFFARFNGDFYPVMKLMDMVNSRELYKCVYETPYDTENDLHNKLSDLEFRLDYEQKSLSCNCCSDIIIDIPEPISFEINLKVIEDRESRQYRDSETVFSAPVVNGFTSSLRKVRIYVPQKDAENFKDSGDFILK